MLYYKDLLTWLFLLSTITVLVASTSLSSPQLLYQAPLKGHRFTNEQSLFDKLAPESDLSIFLEILMHNDLLFSYLNSTTITISSIAETGITEEQQSGEPLTVFCPTNRAFLEYWKTQPKKSWERILERHIVPQKRLDATSLEHVNILNTLLPGSTIHVKLGPSSLIQQQQHPVILLDGDTLVDTSHPIQSSLSIAYKIDHVLPFFFIE
ncbi:hypothetical protein BCR42DRAFT_18319 [Absidia repens]|uniref:FAS1 domain-containing protein n=1 Tax=Absidia repens TaxID=90262 RepID=A0A1X2J2I7_9FUNG|nr:hypothetical protein BCR42DRAFT_18319 [Absidia repens]